MQHTEEGSKNLGSSSPASSETEPLEPGGQGALAGKHPHSCPIPDSLGDSCCSPGHCDLLLYPRTGGISPEGWEVGARSFAGWEEVLAQEGCESHPSPSHPDTSNTGYPNPAAGTLLTETLHVLGVGRACVI